MNEFYELINTVAFPILACIYMAKQQQNFNVYMQDLMKEQTAQNKQMAESIGRLNETLVSIDKRLEHLEKEQK